MILATDGPRTRYNCDLCKRAWITTDPHRRITLTRAGWSALGDDRHMCPRCTRITSTHNPRRVAGEA